MSELKHHGILGQKWGIRRYQNKDGTLTKKGRSHLQELQNIDRNGGKPNHSVDYSRPASEYTTQELNDIVNRVNAEQRYNQLKQNDIDAGKAEVAKWVNRGSAVMTMAVAAANIYDAVNKEKAGLDSKGKQKDYKKVKDSTRAVLDNLKTVTREVSDMYNQKQKDK